jgi:hypothetical protein
MLLRPVRQGEGSTVWWDGRIPIATQVRADDAESSLNQRWSDHMPRCVGARVAVHQQHRRTIPTISDAQTYVANVDVGEAKAVKH